MERATTSRVESSMRLGSYFSMKRSPALLRRMPPSPRTASLTRMAWTPGGQTIAVANMAKALEGVAAESALQNVALLGAVEEGAPLLEFADAVGRFLGVKLGHAPIVEKFSAPHGVAKMSFPVIRGIHVGHGRGDAAFRHDSVGLSEE